MPRLLACCLLCLACSAQAAIYKSVDAEGNTVFSDQPSANATPVQVPPTNTVGNPQPAPSIPSAPAAATPAGPAFSRLEVNLPNDEAIRANNGTFAVGVSLEPALKAGQSLQLLVDGQPYGSPGQSTRFGVTNLERGEHRFAAQVLSGTGEVIQTSAEKTVTVQRISVNSPAR
ncbi:hypothetical protein NS274_17500 [Pseudomonas oryzihabitans]|uniref:DUF4124 domain-containing protein n=1 Tax=Pseudomonas rhizoryzae TaxID=2571129 RepID=UPI0007373F5A|nr:DUF4124 domain-containing protein [Pseudomonas rhizoryzae]APQ12273.1 DUF4124 domain-containing protein [Pseudomonas psychrotolerans]KTS75547.1 hypothetical protein NS274_17500 [Pseudomonas psychrotolerans]KTT28866.1 hypothetical protein NS201_18460 [Pseudomonas psychrotolerans]KTT36985.1 hypothetical protein SB9_03550 [Pseudomonas psychrotolerans]KTT39913.1 hypothetical protein SB5_09920 [Pseudomonas psychrotolerans]